MAFSSDAGVPCVLTIAGSDSGGGAGVQADLKTFAAHGVHGLSAITALTAQNTSGVSAVFVPDPAFLRSQLDAVFSDFPVVAVKIGMLAQAHVIETVADVLTQRRPRYVVLDPVMVATSGSELLAKDALAVLRARLFPLATLLTPNLPEAERLLGAPLDDEGALDAALQQLLALGPRAVLLKGGHWAGTGPVVDHLAFGAERYAFTHPRLLLRAHGTGCTLASAIAANLALGLGLKDACQRGTDYVHAALQRGYPLGRGGLLLLSHVGAASALQSSEGSG